MYTPLSWSTEFLPAADKRSNVHYQEQLLPKCTVSLERTNSIISTQIIK